MEMGRFWAATTFLFGGLIAFLLQIILYSPISPHPLHSPLVSSKDLPANNILQSVVKMGEGILDRPEDTCIDKKSGVLYTATRDGWIKRFILQGSNGSWEDWTMVGGESLLGLAMSMDGAVIVCDAAKGLLKVSDDGVAVLTSEVAGSKLRLVDDAIEAEDGSVYFSDASTKFSLEDATLDALEADPNGRLLKYHPSSKKTEVVLAELTFPNGVALSPAQDYLLVCETWKFRCSKYWLKGQLEGRTEVFIENLPGCPDNINLAEDGSYWIALLKCRNGILLDLVQRWKMAKHLVAMLPSLCRLYNSAWRGAMVVKVGADGRILKSLDDSEGKVMNFVTSALEYEGHLYLGSLQSNFIGKLPLHMVHPERGQWKLMNIYIVMRESLNIFHCDEGVFEVAKVLYIQVSTHEEEKMGLENEEFNYQEIIDGHLRVDLNALEAGNQGTHCYITIHEVNSWS